MCTHQAGQRGRLPSTSMAAPGAAGARPKFAFLAELFVNAGANLAVLDFANIDDVGATSWRWAKQVRAATAWVLPERPTIRRRSKEAFTSAAILRAGISPASSATTDWGEGFRLPKDMLKGAILRLGMYDLKPVRLSKRFEIRQVHRRDRAGTFPRSAISTVSNCPVILAYGTFETRIPSARPAHGFKLKAAGKPVTFLVGEGYNHFEMLETLASPYGLLGRAVLEMMGLKGG